MSVEGCKVVMEEDGSEIVEDERLQEMALKTMMILGKDEHWTPPSGTCTCTCT